MVCMLMVRKQLDLDLWWLLSLLVYLQKDDRAFVSYNKSSRIYEGIGITKVTGAELASGSSATNTSQVYHLDSNDIEKIGNCSY